MMAPRIKAFSCHVICDMSVHTIPRMVATVVRADHPDSRSSCQTEGLFSIVLMVE